MGCWEFLTAFLVAGVSGALQQSGAKVSRWSSSHFLEGVPIMMHRPFPPFSWG
jgi:hypothetical protein